MCSLSRTYSISRQVIQALNPKPHRDTHTHTHTMADVVVLGGDGLRCRSLLCMLTGACDRFHTEAHNSVCSKLYIVNILGH